MIAHACGTIFTPGLRELAPKFCPYVGSLVRGGDKVHVTHVYQYPTGATFGDQRRGPQGNQTPPTDPPEAGASAGARCGQRNSSFRLRPGGQNLVG